ncbi:MAG: hypothetical protein K2J62_09055 [Bacteroidales bacterium]|nr:hypothetical protein [Bacteroidales bacterium]
MNKNILIAILFLLCGVSIYMNIKNAQQIEKLQNDIDMLLADGDMDFPENVQELGDNIISFYNMIFGKANEFISGTLDKEANININS